jgi:hypothetical protein
MKAMLATTPHLPLFPTKHTPEIVHVQQHGHGNTSLYLTDDYG